MSLITRPQCRAVYFLLGIVLNSQESAVANPRCLLRAALQRPNCKRICGGRPCAASSHSAGTAISSPSASRADNVRKHDLRQCSGTMQLPATALNQAFVSELAQSVLKHRAVGAFFMPKARAISRVPTFPAALPMKATRSSLEGETRLGAAGISFQARPDRVLVR